MADAAELIFSRKGLVIALALLTAAVCAYYVRQALRPAPPPPVPIVESKVPTVAVLVASTDLPAGHVVTATDVHWEQWPAANASSQFITGRGDDRELSRYQGSILRSALVHGEPIVQAKLANSALAGYLASTLPPGYRAVSVNITPEDAVNGFISPGDHVDVVLVSPEKKFGGDYYTSQAVLTNVAVIAIDTKTDTGGGTQNLPGRMATLLVTPNQAQLLTVARRAGTLSLVLRSSANAGEVQRDNPECDTRLGRRQSVVVYRYGVAATQLANRMDCN